MAAELNAANLALSSLLWVPYLVAQYWLTAAALDQLDLRSASRPRFLAFFLVGIVTSLGILVGLVLLIVPGLVLMVRWWTAVPTVIASDIGVYAAIDESWRATEGGFWPILAFFLLLYVPPLVAAAGGTMIETLIGEPLVGSLIANLLSNGGAVVGWHGAVAVYSTTQPRADVSDVFS
ncbi:MAG TPA: glycerophosphoryl diester phosphodiesterase membrane domain-containing protein [Allosphingosinicella sp.]|jgi:hypothetical protein|nr:glycerophosphoryl diester phosphodiesterase membrane domain-containing protein [Allosphingosinicella sp.]